MSDGRAPLVCIMGPTAAGKTGLAVELVRRYPFEIISVDSAMIYRGMDIGTAKPDMDILARAPHALIDILDPAERYSAARFVADAEREIVRIEAAGRWPLLVGGTGLYFRALGEGLAALPDADAGLRAALVDEMEQRGLAALHRRLAEVDPQAARRIHANDPQRTLRALEVYELTGVPLSVLQAETPSSAARRLLKLVVAPQDRAWLHGRIEQRFREMIGKGFIEEVEALYRRADLDADLPSMRAVGYRQIRQYLSGELSRAAAIERGIVATRQYAKRQFTWLRREAGAHWLDSRSEPLDAAISLLNQGDFLQ